MSTDQPDVEDYIRLFRVYGEDLGSLYREPEDDRYAFLFEQAVRLLIQPSPFNLSLPEPFRVSARRYYARHPATFKHLSDPANRHFMLCNLHDLVMLKGGLAVKRQVNKG